jgi:hypothetical protein
MLKLALTVASVAYISWHLKSVKIEVVGWLLSWWGIWLKDMETEAHIIEG